MSDFRTLPEDTRIAGYFEDIYSALLARGVPEDRLPTPWSILSHVLDCTDYDALGEWIENFSALESLDSEDTELDESELDESESEDPEPRRKPSYLRALPGSGRARVSEPDSDD
jgi:hypothetical protein